MVTLIEHKVPKTIQKTIQLGLYRVQQVRIYPVNTNSKQPSCKKNCVAPKKAIVKKDVKSKVALRNGCDGRLIANF